MDFRGLFSALFTLSQKIHATSTPICKNVSNDFPLKQLDAYFHADKPRLAGLTFRARNLQRHNPEMVDSMNRVSKEQSKAKSTLQRPGDHPNFRKNALGILGALGEFQGILGATLGIQKLILGNSGNAKFHSRNGISRLEQYENHNSRSNSRSHSQNCWEHTLRVFSGYFNLKRLFSYFFGLFEMTSNMPFKIRAK